jgi:hypothetical protein
LLSTSIFSGERDDDSRARDALRDASDEPYAQLDNEITSMKIAIGELSQRTADAVGDFGVVARKQAKRGVRNARERASTPQSPTRPIVSA